MSMNTEITARLFECVKASGRSYRDISLAAGFGPNFLSQLIGTGRTPSADNLMRILDEMGETEMVYILTGLRFSEDDVRQIRAISKLSDESRSLLEQFVSSLATRQDADENIGEI